MIGTTADDSKKRILARRPRSPPRSGTLEVKRRRQVARNCRLGPRRNERLVDTLDIDERAPSVAPLFALERNQRVDAVSAYKFPVTQRDHGGCTSARHSRIVRGSG